MRCLVTSLLVLWPLLAWSQAFTYQRPFIMASTSTTPVNPDLVLRTNAFLWWSHLDLDTNNVNINSWTDRIQGVIFTNANPSANILNTSTGLYFTGSQWMSNKTAQFTQLPDQSTTMIIFSIQQAVGWLSWDSRYSFGADGFLVGDGGGMTFEQVTHGTEQPAPLVTLNKYVDAALVFSNNVSAFVQNAKYMTNDTYTTLSGNVSYLGMDLTYFCINGALAGQFHGLLCEYIVWTNNTSYQDWNDTPYGMSNTVFVAHRYATNHYGTNILGSNGIWP